MKRIAEGEEGSAASFLIIVITPCVTSPGFARSQLLIRLAVFEKSKRREVAGELRVVNSWLPSGLRMFNFDYPPIESTLPSARRVIFEAVLETDGEIINLGNLANDGIIGERWFAPQSSLVRKTFGDSIFESEGNENSKAATLKRRTALAYIRIIESSRANNHRLYRLIIITVGCRTHNLSLIVRVGRARENIQPVSIRPVAEFVFLCRVQPRDESSRRVKQLGQNRNDLAGFSLNSRNPRTRWIMQKQPTRIHTHTSRHGGFR